MDKHRPYEITNHQEYSIGRFTVVKDTIKIDGKEYPYSYEKVGHCVCILPIIEEDIILIKQYRHSFNEWFYEIPGGEVGKEGTDVAAERELLEETGYIADKMIYLGEYPVTQGTSTAIAFLYVAICSKKVNQELEPTEMIEVRRFSRLEFEEMIKNHEFKHMVGITAWHLYRDYYMEQ